jgi:hypothetical protein
METVDDVLAHFGVKGMKWGVRKASDSSSKPQKMSKMTDDKGRQLTKADAKWAGKSSSTGKGVSAYNKAADAMNSHHIDRINNKPAYKNADFTKDSPLRRKYYKEYEKTFNDEFNKSLKEAFGDSPSGRYTIKSTANMDDGMLPAWTVFYADVKHEDFEMKVVVTFKAGKIMKISLSEPVLSHSEVDEFLEHFGIKGMKWGIRKDKAKRPSIASEDAQRAAASAKIVKRHGTKALNNKELQELVTRMNLEQQFSTLSSKRMGAGEKFARDLLTNVAKQQASSLINGLATQTLNNAMKSKKS